MVIGLDKGPGKQRGMQRKEISELTGLEKEGKPAVPIGVLHVYGTPTVSKALSWGLNTLSGSVLPFKDIRV